jgi:hypothetical protein
LKKVFEGGGATRHQEKALVTVGGKDKKRSVSFHDNESAAEET